MAAEPQVEVETEALESGRYRLVAGNGTWYVGRATDICDRCRTCGCGEQQEGIELPDLRMGQGHIVAWMMSNMNKGLFARLAGMMGRG